MQVFAVDGCEILAANFEGKLYAVQNGCPHLQYPVYLGRLNCKTLTCGFHYAKFDVTTGKIWSPPAKEPLTTFKVNIKGSAVLVELDL